MTLWALRVSVMARARKNLKVSRMVSVRRLDRRSEGMQIGKMQLSETWPRTISCSSSRRQLSVTYPHLLRQEKTRRVRNAPYLHSCKRIVKSQVRQMRSFYSTRALVNHPRKLLRRNLQKYQTRCHPMDLAFPMNASRCLRK